MSRPPTGARRRPRRPPRSRRAPTGSIPSGATTRFLARTTARITVVVATILAVLVGVVGVASAHVTVNPNSVTAGSYAKLTFRVPTESAKASTISVRVSLPAAHPIPTVMVMQVPGWTATVTKTALNPPVTQGKFTLTEAVTAIAWTADDHVGIGPEEFMEFAISVGPVPDVPSLQFPTEQTMSDGTVVRWDQPPASGGTAPDHPAPTLTVVAAGAGSNATGSAAASTGPTVTGSADAAIPSGEAGPYRSTLTVTAGDNTARVLSVGALIVAALALLVAVLGARRRPRTPGSNPTRTDPVTKTPPPPQESP